MARASLIHAVIDKAADALSRGCNSHNFWIGKRRTSARLDELTWNALQDIARR
jgi:predicted DNA-binding ribbon-helix-helix protein